MKNLLGIVFSNTHQAIISELTPHRCMGSLPVGGRYRLIDFVLSTLANSGIEDVGVITQTNYQSLMDHLGNGREWDLSRKTGGLVILPPFSRTESGMYRGRIDALYGILEYLRSSPASHVILCDCDMLFNTTYDDMLLSHIDSGADITVLYKKMPLEKDAPKDTCVLSLAENGRVHDVMIAPPLTGEQNIYLNIMILSKSLLEYLVSSCYSRNQYSLERDILQAKAGQYHIHAYEYTGYVSRLSSLQTYYDANLALLDPQVRRQLFPRDMPIYTRVRDDAPVRYGLGSKVSNSLLADGCVVEGEVENSVLFRGVTVGKKAKVKNSIVMQGTVIGENSHLEWVMTDKNVTVRKDRTLTGFRTYPVYIAKGSVI
jgi:glucose-1-phosphate adenylyltransferase